MLRITLGALAFALLTPISAAAQSPFATFKSIKEVEKMIGDHIMALRFDEAVRTADPTGRGMSEQDRSNFVNVLSNFYKTPMTQRAMIKQEVMGGGFHRALYAYWEDRIPVYLYVVTQERNGEFWILQWNIDTTFSSMISKF